MNGPMVTYDEYLGLVAINIANAGNQRPGQVFFNTLRTLHPELAEEVRATALDPFYTNERLPDFLAHVYQRWGGVE